MKKISVLLSIAATIALAKSFVVCPSGCEYSSIQQAIDDLNNSKGEYQVYVKAGTYHEHIEIKDKNVTLVGENATNTILDGEDNIQLIHMEGPCCSDTYYYVTIKNFSIINGYSNSWGGGIRVNQNVNVNLQNIIFRNNLAVYDGGAISKENSTGYLQINNVKFFNNNARSGGAFYADAKDLKVQHCEFSGNNANANGGAIYLAYNKNVLIENTIFIQNSAPYGGAINTNWTTDRFAVSSSWFIGNYASKNGGAIDNNADKFSLENSILAYNKAGEQGGALYVPGDTGLANIKNSDIVFNSCENNISDGIFFQNAYNTIVIESSVFKNAQSDIFFTKNPDNNQTVNNLTLAYNALTSGVVSGTMTGSVNEHDNIYLDENTSLFVDPQHYDFSLAQNTPIIDSVPLGYALAFDIAGTARPQGDASDMGACEAPSVCKLHQTTKIVPVCTIGDQSYVAQKVTIHVDSGWNLKSIPYYQPITVGEIFGDNLDKIRTVWFWNTNDKKWYVYSPDPAIEQIINNYATLNFIGVSDRIDVGSGFWIDALTPFDFEVPVFVTQ